MKKKIGILIPPLESGGVFQHALTIIESLINYSDKFDYQIIHYDSERENLENFLNLKLNQKHFLSIPYNPFSLPRKILRFLNLIFGGEFFPDKNFYPILKNNKIDLLIFPTPFTFMIPYKIPYIVFIPDLMYRYYPNFSDYDWRLRIKRDIVYGYFAKHSVLNVVDSEQGADDLSKFFNIKKEKIRIIPHTPASYLHKYKEMDLRTIMDILAKYNLPEKFLFYPSQFWPHKNHLRLIKALHLIRETSGLKIPLVLAGSFSALYRKTYEEIMELIRRLNIAEQIIHLGYVSKKEIVALYKKSTALIFPTLIGPTSIPPLEAMILGTPVVCSNLFEMPKQVGEAGLLFNPFSVEDIAEKIHKIWTDKNLRQEFVRKGYEKTKNINLENYSKRWERIIDEAFVYV